jgi:hypothetical protein
VAVEPAIEIIPESLEVYVHDVVRVDEGGVIVKGASPKVLVGIENVPSTGIVSPRYPCEDIIDI